MDEQIQAWEQRIDAVTTEVKSQFGDLSPEQLNWKPTAEKWSIAEVFQHLVLVNRSYDRVLTAVANGTSNPGWTAHFGFLVRYFGTMIHRSVDPTREKKIRTFTVWEPTSSHVDGNVINDFVSEQERIKELIRRNKESIEKDIVVPSPANRYVVYRLRKALEIIVSHEERHLNQALEVRESFQATL